MICKNPGKFLHQPFLHLTVPREHILSSSPQQPSSDLGLQSGRLQRSSGIRWIKSSRSSFIWIYDLEYSDASGWFPTLNCGRNSGQKLDCRGREAVLQPLDKKRPKDYGVTYPNFSLSKVFPLVAPQVQWPHNWALQAHNLCNAAINHISKGLIFYNSSAPPDQTFSVYFTPEQLTELSRPPSWGIVHNK